MNFSLLDHIHIVLVETTLPANIGSAARAMKTMGFNNLHVVNPKYKVNSDANARAAGATSVLENIIYHDTLDQAIADSHIVWAASGRTRSLPIPLVSLKQACTTIEQFLPSIQSSENVQNVLPKMSILFGREDRGLTNAELSKADLHVTIPSNPEYGVLNLAAAVQVFCYEIYQFLAEENRHFYQNLTKSEEYKEDEDNHSLMFNIRTDWDEQAVNQEQISQLKEKILELAEILEIFDSENPRNTPARLNRVLKRTQLDKKEYNFIRAILGKSIKNLQ